MGSDDQSQNIVIKGKRTKRQRSSSPFCLATMTDSSSSGSADGHRTVRGGAGDHIGVIVDDYNSISSPTTSGEIYESTEEEEDMANCLIMLAQGEGPRQIQENNSIIGEKITKLSNSRKLSCGIVSTATNKAGFYVYKCKTCNRSFPSFQALGGHRASHKKPKTAIEESKSSSVAVLPLKENYYSEEAGPQFNKLSPPPTHLSVQAVGNKGNKIHECSICGSEFTSGQALGGHMRRHRTATAAATVNIQAAAAAIDVSSTICDQVKPEETRRILPLDLNLPAPEDHDHHNHDHHHLRDSKFQFGSTQQALVFSAPALVDCRY